jgi:hypothetical protein
MPPEALLDPLEFLYSVDVFGAAAGPVVASPCWARHRSRVPPAIKTHGSVRAGALVWQETLLPAVTGLAWMRGGYGEERREVADPLEQLKPAGDGQSLELDDDEVEAVRYSARKRD